MLNPPPQDSPSGAGRPARLAPAWKPGKPEEIPVPPDYGSILPPKANILIVAGPENQRLLEASLADLGQNVLKAASEEEALRYLLRMEFAVLLLQVRLPGLDGFDLAARIRQRASTEHLPIIFLTEAGLPEGLMFKGYSLGAVDYLFTPPPPGVLRSKAGVFVDLFRQREAARRRSEELQIGAERELQQRMREASRRLELQTTQNRFFTLSEDLLAITDLEGRFLELNPAWEKTLGQTEKELKAAPFWWPMDEPSREAARRALRETRETNEPAHFEAGCLVAGGARRYWGCTLAPYPAGQMLYFFARDLTVRRQAESRILKLNTELRQRAAELEAANAALQESNAALESFPGAVSHDLRAPVRAMRGYASAVLEDFSGELSAEGLKYMDRIAKSAARMEELIDDLLAYSRLRQASVPADPLALADGVREALAQFDTEIRARGAAVEVAGPLPVVMAHAPTLQQVLTNLLANALKFVGPGQPPKLRLWAAAEGGATRIWIEDNGIGIAPEHHERIFLPFERLHGVHDYPGTGLGLAIVQKGVERMNGKSGVESQPGQGSRFWFQLPVPPAS